MATIQYPIEELYPELKAVPTVSNRHRGLAWFDYGIQWAFYLNQECVCYRLGEVMDYSDHLFSVLESLLTTYIEQARHAFSQAAQYLGAIPSLQYNQHLLQLLTTAKRSERTQSLTLIEQLLHQDLSMVPEEAIFRQTIQNTLSIVSSLSLEHILYPQLFKPNTDVPVGEKPSFIRYPMAELQQIHISAEERSQAFAKRQQCLLQQVSNTVDYQYVKWRLGLVKALWEAEYPATSIQTVRLLSEQPDPIFEAQIEQQGWQRVESAPYQMVLLWHLPDYENQTLLLDAWNHLEPGGLFLAAVPRTQVEPEQARSQLACCLGTNVYLIDREAFTDVLVAFCFKIPAYKPQLKVLIVMRPDSIVTFGGADFQMFRSRALFKNHGITSDITLANRLEISSYDVVYVVGYLHQDYQFHLLQQSTKPVVAMPIATLYYFESKVMDEIYYAAHSLTSAISQHEMKRVLEQFLANVSLAQFQQCALQKTIDMLTVKRIHYLLRQLGQSCHYFVPQAFSEVEAVFPDTYEAQTNYECLPNGCETTLFATATAALFEHHYPWRNFILCVGRLERNKNQLMLCYALRNSRIPVVLVGRPADDYGEQYLELCKSVGPVDLHHIEQLSPELLASAFKAAALFVLPSVSEASPLSVIEATAAGCPVAVTKNTVHRQEWGDFFYDLDPFDPQQIEQTITQAWQADNRQRVAQAQAQLLQNCSWASTAARLATVFQALCHVRPGYQLVKCTEQYFEKQSDWRKRLPTQDLPLLFSLNNPRELLDPHTLFPDHLHCFFEVQTDWAVHCLRQAGFSAIRKPHTLKSPVQKTPLPIEKKTYNVLAFYDSQNELGWKESLTAYLRFFNLSHSAQMLLYAGSWNTVTEANIADQVVQHIEKAGFDPEQIPEIALLASPYTPAEQNYLLQMSDILMLPLHQAWGWEQLWCHLLLSEQPLLSLPLHQNVPQQPHIWLYTWEQLTQMNHLPSVSESDVLTGLTQFYKSLQFDETMLR